MPVGRYKKLIFIFFIAQTGVSDVNAGDIMLNQSVPQMDYSLNKVRAIFTMRQIFWSNGEKIKVFILADDHPIHKKFTKNNLHMFPHQLRRVWDRIVFSGMGKAPYLVATEAEMLDKISNTPNAIGYLSNGSNNEKIRLFDAK